MLSEVCYKFGGILLGSKQQGQYKQRFNQTVIKALKMELVKILTIILFIASLLFQGINLASQAMGVKTYQDADSLSVTTPTTMQKNQGYFTSVLGLSGLSVLLYVYLLVVKLLDKSPSMIVDWTIWILALVFQFAVATVLVANIRNIKVDYDTYMASLDLLEATGATSGATYELLVNYRTTYNLSLAAAVIDYAFNFTCGIVLLIANTKNVLQNPKTSPQGVKQSSSMNNIAQ